MILEWLKINGEDGSSHLATSLARVAEKAEYEDIEDILGHCGMVPSGDRRLSKELSVRLPIGAQLLQYGAAPLVWLTGLLFWQRRLRKRRRSEHASSTSSGT